MTTEYTINKTHSFSIIMPVRITDINYGMHLGHVATVGIFHNARVLFLNNNGFDEMNIDNLGLILVNSSYSFKTEAKFNSELLVSVSIGEFSKLKFCFLYRAVNQESGLEVVSGQEEMLFFDYSKKKVSKIPERFLKFCKTQQINHLEKINA